MNKKELFDVSKQLWGLHSQLDMLAEEASELSTATLHMNRATKNKGETWENFAEEIADVEFMIDEMKHYFPVLQAKVNLYRRMKEERLSKMLQIEKLNMCTIKHVFQEKCCAHSQDSDCHIQKRVNK